MRHHGHFSIWHVDTLARLCDGWLTPGTDAEPPVLRGFRRTRTDVAPMTTRGIDWEQVKLLSAVGARALGLAALQSREEQQAVLQYPALVGAGDAAGIERATGIRTSSARLLALASQVCLQAAADAALNAAGVMTLQDSLHRTAGDAPPRELQLNAAPPPAAAGVAGPLPFDAGQGRRGCGAAIIEPANGGEEDVMFDDVNGDDDMAADGDEEEGGDMGGDEGGDEGGEDQWNFAWGGLSEQEIPEGYRKDGKLPYKNQGDRNWTYPDGYSPQQKQNWREWMSAQNRAPAATRMKNDQRKVNKRKNAAAEVLSSMTGAPQRRCYGQGQR